jgi:hypothetical protein
MDVMGLTCLQGTHGGAISFTDRRLEYALFFRSQPQCRPGMDWLGGRHEGEKHCCLKRIPFKKIKVTLLAQPQSKSLRLYKEARFTMRNLRLEEGALSSARGD